MGAPLGKDVSDISKIVTDHTYVSKIPWWEWIKREAPDDIIWGRLEVILKDIAQHVDVIEEHLEKGAPAGKSFVRFQERPSVGGGELEQVMEPIRLLGQRLDRIEQGLAKSGILDAGGGGKQQK